MEYVTKGYQPEDACAIFEEIAQIPHGSYNEGRPSANTWWTSPPPTASSATGMSCLTSL